MPERVPGPCTPTGALPPPPHRRLGRMWWQLQLGGQDVGVGADERSPTAVFPPTPAPASTPSGSRALGLGTEGLFPIFRGRTSQSVAMDLSCITPFSGPPSPAQNRKFGQYTFLESVD